MLHKCHLEPAKFRCVWIAKVDLYGREIKKWRNSNACNFMRKLKKSNCSATCLLQSRLKKILQNSSLKLREERHKQLHSRSKHGRIVESQYRPPRLVKHSANCWRRANRSQCQHCRMRDHQRITCKKFKRKIQLLWSLGKCFLEPGRLCKVWIAKHDLYGDSYLSVENLNLSKMYDESEEISLRCRLSVVDSKACHLNANVAFSTTSSEGTNAWNKKHDHTNTQSL